ncbi:MAG TPA: hemolysin III family protein [Ilumatobacteraceae bacterium]
MNVVLARPSWRGWLHAAAFAAAIPAGIVLILSAGGAAARTGASIYVAGVLLGFGTSAAYHRLARSDGARRIMQRLDHSMIFVLIAATYTPICLIALPRSWGIPVLVAVWAAAALGIVIKLTAFDRLPRLGYAMYPILGWAAVIAMPVMVTHLTAAQLALVIAGGLMYTLGLPVLITKRPNPWPARFGYHEVWHSFTIVAGVCHFAAIGLLVR